MQLIQDNTVIGFGKYKGKNYSEILQTDPDYIEWLVSQENNSKNIVIAKEIIKKYRKLEFEQYCNTNNNYHFDAEYELPFGKYKGKKLINVLTFDPSYITWLQNEIPLIPRTFHLWNVLKRQISDLQSNSQNFSIQQEKHKKQKNRISETVLETYKLYKEGKRPEEIAVLRKFKVQTVEDHLAQCIESGLIEVTELIDIEVCNYIADIITEKCEGKMDKLKPIKETCDAGEIEISYSEIKYTIAYLNK